MQRQCQVVMYHYVRDVEKSQFRPLNSLSISEFARQLEYFSKKFNFVSTEQFVGALRSDLRLPQDSVFLTFDDGYLDHFLNVFPLLERYGVQGAFFVPVRPVRDRKVLDVNKIHFLLGTMNAEELRIRIFQELDKLRSEGFEIEANHELFERLAISSRFDDPVTNFVKKLLQRELPSNIRENVVGSLFGQFVTVNETEFADELYLNMNQIRIMYRQGMTIGVHGFNHLWMDTLSTELQKQEIDLSLEFLLELGIPTENWLLAYPYGAYDEKLKQVCKERGCGAAFTTRHGVADFGADNSLEIPRLDTNEFKSS